MILVDLDFLSFAELKAIAKDEGLDDIENRSREDIVKLLREIYNDDDIEDVSLKSKYISGVTDFREIDQFVPVFPGVDELPASYNSTSIHILLKDSSWLYCFWQLSDAEKLLLEEKRERLNLVLHITKEDSTENIEVEVSASDSERSVNIPLGPGKCSVSLVSGTDRVLCESKEIDLPEIYWLNNREEMNSSGEIYSLFQSIVTSGDGIALGSLEAEGVLNAFKEEDSKR